MKYTEGYKYRLEEPVTIVIPFLVPDFPIEKEEEKKEMVQVKGQILEISKHYSWDGSSGIPDTKCNLYASLIHDAWYQLIRRGLVCPSTRILADTWYGELCRINGVPSPISKLYAKVLKKFGLRAATKPREVLCV